MTTTITHYTDYKSPYAYLAMERAYQLEADFDVIVDWRPFTLDIASFAGSVDDRSPEQWRKVKYSYMDARRWANKRGLTLRGPRKVYDSSPAQIGMLYAQQNGVFRAYNDLMFQRFWEHQVEVDDVAGVTAILAEAGADADGFAGFLTGEGRRRHDMIQAEAMEAGVFGVPTFILDGELFWGYDRIGLLRERLGGPAV